MDIKSLEMKIIGITPNDSMYFVLIEFDKMLLFYQGKLIRPYYKFSNTQLLPIFILPLTFGN